MPGLLEAPEQERGQERGLEQVRQQGQMEQLNSDQISDVADEKKEIKNHLQIGLINWLIRNCNILHN